MGNTHSSQTHGHGSSKNSRRTSCLKRQSRSNSCRSDSTTSTSSSSPRSCHSRSSTRVSSPSSKQHRSLNGRSNSRYGEQDEVEVKAPIRIGYPYYEDVTMLAEKGSKKKKRRSFK